MLVCLLNPSKTSKNGRAAVVSALATQGVGTEPSQFEHVCELVPVKNVQNTRDSFGCVGKAQSRGDSAN